jgi:hypothetical protein
MSARARVRGTVVAALLILQISAGTALAGKAPSLASTAQYRAFVEYVKKLDGLAGQPTSAAQKNSYETELTAKKEAASHKANALFNRESEEAQAEFGAKAKEQAEAVRRTEGEEVEALQAEFGAKYERAAAGYHAKLERIATGHEHFEARVKEQIAGLRAKKAQTTDPAQKDAIQEQITGLIDEIRGKRQEESQKRADLKTGYREQKEELHAAEAKREAEIGEAAEAKIDEISKHWKKAYNDKKAKLNAKRESQLAYLDSKLEKGRADIAAMPATP